MYRCENCNVVVPAGTPRVLVIAETRRKVYDLTQNRNDKDKKKRSRYGEEGAERAPEVSTGWEIAKEVALCPRCGADWAEKHAAPGAPAERVTAATIADTM